MIVLPLIEEARSARRPPWVTLVFVVACVAVFLYNRDSDRRVDERTDAALEQAWTYFSAHPYVKLDEDLTEMFGPDAITIAVQTFRQQLSASHSPGIPDFVRLHDQVEFDRRVEAVYQAMEGHSFFRLGFFPEAMSAPDATFLTYVFAHEDWLHLVSNLALVLIAGLFLEEVWGHGLFLVFVLTGAIAGAVGYATLDPEAGEALGGASGLAAAMAGAFLVRFATVPIRFQYFYIPPFGGRFTARGWITLPIYGALYVVAEYLLTQGAPGIEPVTTEFATWAHVGGLVWGIAFALAIAGLRIEERFISPKIEKKRTTRSNPMLDRALEAREAGRSEEAFELLAREVARHPGDRDAALAFWDAATAVGRPDQAAEALARTLREEISGGQKELAVQHWRELTQRVPEFPLDAALEVRIVGLLIEAGEHDLADFSTRRVLDGSCGAVSGAVAHKLARLTQDLDTSLSLGAARRALAANDLDPAEVAEVQRLAEQLERVRAREGEETAADGSDAYDRDDRSLSLEEGASADDGPDLDGDTLNAPPFELDELTAPPGVRTLDLEGAAADAAPAAEASGPARESSLPGVTELAPEDLSAPTLDALPASPLEAATVPPLDVGTAPPLDAGTVPPLDVGT
ncbi:MAG TPA: rhomboid family intramembrane serine protease, partial [Myxococcota bacterium]|nr:rhomboid family intramembrane serine protease [Myxococcota bacterium]